MLYSLQCIYKCFWQILVLIAISGCDLTIQRGDHAVTEEKFTYEATTNESKIVLSGTDQPFEDNNNRAIKLMTIAIEPLDGPVTRQGTKSMHEGIVSTVDYWWETPTSKYSFVLTWNRRTNEIKCSDLTFLFVVGMEFNVVFAGTGVDKIGQVKNGKGVKVINGGGKM